MKNDEWKPFAALARGWTSTTEESTTAMAVNGLLDAGDANRAERENIVNAVKAMMNGEGQQPIRSPWSPTRNECRTDSNGYRETL